MSAYQEVRSELAQDLINSYDLYLDEPEHLREPTDLEHFLKSHAIAVKRRLTVEDLENVRQFRSQLRHLWTSDDLSTLVAALNKHLTASPVVLEVGTDDKEALHINYTIQPGLTSVQELVAKAILGLLTVLEHYGLERMGACAADPCQDVFIDVSRNRSRRFCSDRCANRYNIAAYRERNQE